MTVTELPRATHDDETGASAPRWVPTRAGILNVWRYYDEVFEFHEGRLLLRGPNGSGKSKALELLLPFLFDANLRANRLSTFGTGERTMHWNLMGEGASGTTRVGYVWLEFRFPGRWFSCGARLQASSHTTTVHPDYFTTEQRIGTPEGLSLVNDAGQPLTKKALEERLGSHGTVHASASDYRAEIRSTLFPTLTEQRFDALITALLQLRTPKLSQRLDPALLSTLLSRALPPLGQQEISELAEGFERLDKQRERLATLEAEVTATRTLATRQRTYAQRVLRAGAASVISATSELEKLAKAARQSAEQYETVAQQKEDAEHRIETLASEIGTAEARKAGLTESEAYKQGQELDRLRQRTAEARTQAGKIRDDAGKKRAFADRDEQARQDAERTARRQAEIVQTQEIETRQAAARAGLTSVHGEITAQLDTAAESARPLLRAAVRSKEEQLRVVGQALDSHERAIERRQEAEEDLDGARSVYSTAQDQLDTAARDRDTALHDLSVRLMEWAEACAELVFPEPRALLDHLESETALLTAVDAVASPFLDEITRRETTRTTALATSREQRDQLAAEVARLRTEEDLPPAAPPTRTADREAMTGAPLWRLVDFAATTPESAYAGIEAALEASGLLDAWVGPLGDIPGHDIFAEPEALASVAGRSLADVLVPEAGAETPAPVVRRLLEAVAFDERLPSEGAAAIGADGTWRLGNLLGSWQKDHPAYIGALARHRARERRIHELRAQISEHEVDVARLETELAALATRRQVIKNERAARPGYAALDAATQQLTRAELELATADRIVRQRAETVSAREKDVARTLHALIGLAAEHGVPTERAALSTLSTSVGAFSNQAENWLEQHDKLLTVRQTLASLTAQAERSVDHAAQREEEAQEAEEEHQKLVAMLEAIDSTFGVDYREVLVEIEGLRTKLTELDDERKRTTNKVTELATQLGRLETQRANDAKVHEEASVQRDTAAQRFRRLAAGTFPADSGIDDLAKFEAMLGSGDGVRAALDAARLVAAAWPSIPHTTSNIGDALHRLSESVHTCRDALSSRADLDLETDEDVQVFTAVVDGLRVGAAELLRILRTEADQSRDEITERERELFDQTLTGDTRRHLAARIRQANELVDGMNSRLERVRTASKVAVRLVWQVAPDLPPGTKAARDLLLKDPVRLTDADRESLHRFFRDRIEQAKADDTATSWEQQLAQVFDYTAWHRFVVKVDRANGDGWQLLTRKLHGALSGGEKAIALHLPLFAAVAAHYQAAPEAPRIILLDEVFVGVDSTNRGQVFALLSALDLDLMLTSDHEWCVYSELSGIGIHQLITGGDGDDAVTTARFTWDGHDLLPAEPD
ncbi:TIGR02680 family protein [Amycolatopsis samaneae]|uniref:TIGR02680 family protein n=1 Tax=Amycolatopsis samaneae TaxID=664691 RepID=A0ABW5GIE6_9PSEU